MQAKPNLQALLGVSAAAKMERAAEAGTSRGSEILTNLDCPNPTRSHPSALDASLEITIFPDTFARTARRETRSLRDLAQMVRETRAGSKANLPLWKLATFGQSCTIKGSLRFDANLLRVSGIEGDHDAGTLPAEEAASRLRAAGIAALVHETPSHRPEAPRWRVLCPLAAPVAREARADLVARLNGALGGVLAPESFTPSQAFYFGAIEGQPEPAAILVEGQPLDTLSDLPRIGKHGETEAQAPEDEDEDDSDLWAARDWQPERIKEALDAISDASDRDTWLTIGMALHHASEGRDEGRALWDAWSRKCPEKFVERVQRATWKGFRREGVTIATLYKIAKRHGWPKGAPASGSHAKLAALLGTAKPEAAAPWMEQLDRDKEGRVKATLGNLALILRNDPRTAGCLAYDLFAGRIVLQVAPDLPGDFWKPGALSDIHVTGFKDWLTRSGKRGGWGLTPTAEAMQDGIALAAHAQRFHPIRAWLDGLHHDGKPRVDSLFPDYLGVADRAYYRETARCTLVAAVARVFEPGHKFDFVPIIEGGQGVGKSTFVRILGGQWGGDPTISHWDEPQKLGEQIAGFWIIEMGELAAMYKAEANAMKAGISKTEDTYRSPYARLPETRPRQCIFVGTTNDSTYLKDPTGNRRFWPIPSAVEKIDLAGLQREMPQIWAEAVATYRAMRAAQPEGTLPLCLRSAEARDEALELQGSRKQETAEEMLAARIVAWVQEPIGPAEGADPLDPAAPQKRRDFICASSVWHELLGNGEGCVMSKAQSIMHGEALALAARELGWPQVRERIAGHVRARGYRRPGTWRGEA